MGSRFAFSLFDTIGTAATGAGALKAGVKASSRTRLTTAVKKSVEESADAAAKAERKLLNGGGAGKGAGNGGSGGGGGGKPDFVNTPSGDNIPVSDFIVSPNGTAVHTR